MVKRAGKLTLSTRVVQAHPDGASLGAQSEAQRDIKKIIIKLAAMRQDTDYSSFIALITLETNIFFHSNNRMATFSLNLEGF